MNIIAFYDIKKSEGYAPLTGTGGQGKGREEPQIINICL
jgi:hypothetical protein